MKFSEAPGAKYHDYIFRSPVCAAIWPHLLTPDTRFDDQGKFKIGVELEPADLNAARDAMRAMYKRAFPDAPGEPHLPFKVEGDRTYLVAKSTYKPKLLTPDRKEIVEPLLVRHGHKVRITGRVRAFRNKIVSGLACYLSAVEVHEDLSTLETYRVDRVTEGAFLATDKAPSPYSPPLDDLPF